MIHFSIFYNIEIDNYLEKTLNRRQIRHSYREVVAKQFGISAVFVTILVFADKDILVTFLCCK